MAAKAPTAIWVATIVMVLINVDVSSPRVLQTVDEKRNSINDNNGNRKERSLLGIRFNQDSLNGVYTSGSDSDKQQDIFFPGQFPERIEPRSVSRCKGRTVCENVPDYPINSVHSLIERNPDIRKYQIDDMSEFINSRSDISEAQQLCTSYKKVVYPKLAKMGNGEWMYVLNTDNFKQGVLIETCQNEGASCSIINGFALSYVTICKQKYIFRELFAINGTNVEREPFMLPANCCCHVDFTRDEIAR